MLDNYQLTSTSEKMKSKSLRPPGLRPAASHSLDLSPCRLFLKEKTKKEKDKEKRQICKGHTNVKMWRCEENDISWFRPALGLCRGNDSWMDFLGTLRAKNSCHESFLFISMERFGKISNADLQWMSGDWKSFPESVQASAAFSRGLLRVLCALTKAGANLGILILTWILECIQAPQLTISHVLKNCALLVFESKNASKTQDSCLTW